MAGSLNKVLLIGNVGQAPELRTTNNGTRVATISLATNESWRDKNTNERKERVDWHRVVIFNEKIVEVVEKYVKKGSKIWISGALQTRKWTDNSGVKKYVTEIVLQAFRGELQLLDRAEGGGNRPPNADSADDYGSTSSRPDTSGFSETHRDGAGNYTIRPPMGGDLDDEIPF